MITSLLVFFGLGLLTGLSPCSYPIIPIMLSIITTSTNKSPLHKYGSLAIYVLTVSFILSQLGYWGTKLELGILVFNSPIILVTFSALVVLMALYQFDILHFKFEWSLQIPAVNSPILKTVLLGISGALMMGPCMSPAIGSALAFMASSASPLVASLSLGLVGLGMQIPLLLAAIFGTAFLPKSGPWLTWIKKGTGLLLLMLAVAIIVPIFGIHIL